MKLQSKESRGAFPQMGIVLCLVALAGIGGCVVFFGWIFDVPPLQSIGIGGVPMWPLPAIGYMFLSFGFWATIREWRVAPWLLVPPITIAALTLFEVVFNVSTGVDKLLFTQQVEQSSGIDVGRPVINSVVTLGLLGLALMLARHRSHAAAELANLLATASLCFGLFSAVFLSLVTPDPDAVDPSIIAPLCCSLIAILLGSAFLVWRHDSGWTLLLTDDQMRRPFVGALLPLVIALPILPTLVERWDTIAPSAPSRAEMLGILCNVAIIGFMLWVAVRRITRQQGVLQELSLAMDVTAIAITRLDGTILYWSGGCERLYGWAAAEALGQRKYELLRSSSGLHQAVALLDAPIIERALVERRRTGGEISVLELTRRLDRQHREPILVLKMADITERVRTEGALRSSESQLRSIIETMPDAIVVTDEQGVICTFSAAAERMFGHRSAAILGRRIDCLMEENAQDGENWVANYLVPGELGTIAYASKLIAQRADGSLFPIELSVGETTLDGRRFFTGIIRDVTERRAAEHRVSELAAELMHVSRQTAMSEVAADLAHELNQPLSAAANFQATARMLAGKTEVEPRLVALMQKGEDQTLRAGEIIRRLRNFLSKGSVQFGPEALEETVREAVDLVFFGAAKGDIKLVYRFDPDADIIWGDRTQVQQVLVNLLRNAIQALRASGRAGGQIAIDARRISAMVEISIRDNGPGLPDAIRGEIYSRFSSAGDHGGMGIGLSISSQIIEAHGGKLAAENNSEGGACFRFTLPAVGEMER